jgi:PAS domain S-box-containing protein
LIQEKYINWRFKNLFTMTFKELNRINSESAFKESRMHQLKSILLLLTIGGFIIVLLWQMFDKYYLLQPDNSLFWLRILTVAMYIANFTIAYFRKSEQAYKQHLTAGFYFGTIFCTLLAMFTGASQSPYWFGLFFILIGWFVLVPFNYRELIIHSLMFLLIFMAGLFVQTEFKLIDYEIAKIVFLYSGTLFIGSYAAYRRNTAEAENYLSNKALKAKNKELSKFILVLEQAPGSVFIMDNKMNFEYINPVFTQLSGYTEDDLLHKNINDTIYKGKTPESRTEVAEALRNGEKWQGELLTYHKTGKSYWANTIAAPYKDETGIIEGYVVIQQDITERKNMELALKESEQLYRTLIEKSLNGVALTSDRKFFLVNQSFCNILGYSMEEIMKIQPESLLAPQDRERVLAIHDKRMHGEVDSLSYHAKFVHKSGALLTVEMSSTTVQINGSNSSFVTLRDITEQQTLKEALEQSVQKYRDLADLLPQTVYELDLQGKITFMNQAGINAFGEVLQSKDLSALDFIAPEDHQRLVENLQASYQGKKPTSGNEYTALRSDGSRYPIMVFGAPVFSNGVQTGTRGIIIDISERKAMENALRESESKYKTLIENSQDGVFAIIGDKIEFVNSTLCKMLGYSAEELYNMPAINMVVPEDRQRGMEISQRRKAGDWSTVNGIFHFLAKDGSVRECDTFSSILELNGQTVSYITVHDLTENRRMQEQLKLSEEKYRTVIEKATDGIVITQHGKLKFMNKSMIDMMQYDEAEIIDKPFIDFVPEEDRQLMIDLHKRRMAGEDFTSLYRSHIIRKDGKIITVELNGRTSNYNDEPAAFIIIRDISQREEMEDALRKSEDRFRRMIQSLQEGLFVVQDEKFVFVNEAIVDILGYTVEEMTGRCFYDVMPPENMEQIVSRHQDRIKGEKGSWSYEYTLLHKDGVTRVPVILSTNLTEFDGKLAVVGTAKDITERVRAEKELLYAHNRLEEINHMLEHTIAERTQELTEANTQLLKLQKENLQSQFDVLKQQVNPHFLFNSLNVLTSLIRLEPELAEKFTEHLSKVYRYVLENKDNELVKLTTELDFLDAYIFLLNIRFMGKITVNINIPDELRNCLVIPLAMQLLIENAIKHNAMSKKSPLVIDVFIDDNHFLNIINNLQEREAHMVSTGVGLKNIQNRYLLLNNTAPEFEKTATHFIARIPLICEQNS